MKILFCQLKSYGDIIRTFKTIDAVRNKYPNSYLAGTCLEGMEEVMSLCNSLDEVITQPKLLAGNNVRLLNCEILEKAINKVKDLSFDYYIDFDGELQSALFGILSKIPRRIGANKPSGRDGAYLFYTDLINIKWKEINRMERHFLLCKGIFKDIKINPNTKINKTGNIIIAPGTSKLGDYKRWTIDGYANLIDSILKNREEDIEILVYKDDCSIGIEIINQLKSIYKNNRDIIKASRYKLTIVNSFLEAFERIKVGKVLISTDSAFAHIAVVNDIATFMILGPSSVIENSPWNRVKSAYVINKVSCSPCKLWKRSCENNNKCMKELTANKVYKEFLSFIETLI